MMRTLPELAKQVPALDSCTTDCDPDHGIRLSTKIGVYGTVVLTTLLYRSESWTWYCCHVKKLDQFHLRCLRKICGISWKDRIPNTTVLERCEIEGIEALLQLRWTGHLTRMEENRIQKAQCLWYSVFLHASKMSIPSELELSFNAFFCGELVGGQRSRGCQHKRNKDVLKYNLKACDIPIETWERQALNRPEVCTACHVGVESFECCHIELLQETHIARHAAQNQSLPNTDYVCPDCQRNCHSRIGLINHRRKYATLLNWCFWEKGDLSKRRLRPPFVAS